MDEIFQEYHNPSNNWTCLGCTSNTAVSVSDLAENRCLMRIECFLPWPFDTTAALIRPESLSKFDFLLPAVLDVFEEWKFLCPVGPGDLIVWIRPKKLCVPVIRELCLGGRLPYEGNRLIGMNYLVSVRRDLPLAGMLCVTLAPVELGSLRIFEELQGHRLSSITLSAMGTSSSRLSIFTVVNRRCWWVVPIMLRHNLFEYNLPCTSAVQQRVLTANDAVGYNELNIILVRLRRCHEGWPLRPRRRPEGVPSVPDAGTDAGGGVSADAVADSGGTPGSEYIWEPVCSTTFTLAEYLRHMCELLGFGAVDFYTHLDGRRLTFFMAAVHFVDWNLVGRGLCGLLDQHRIRYREHYSVRRVPFLQVNAEPCFADEPSAKVTAFSLGFQSDDEEQPHFVMKVHNTFWDFVNERNSERAPFTAR